MKEDEHKQIRRSMEQLDQVLLGVRATGGFKFREKIRKPTGEINAFVESAEKKIRGLTISSIISLSMLAERDFFGRNRLEEYQVRVQEALTRFNDQALSGDESAWIAAARHNEVQRTVLLTAVRLLNDMVENGRPHTRQSRLVVSWALECIEKLDRVAQEKAS